jgi:hypothetical protein
VLRVMSGPISSRIEAVADLELAMRSCNLGMSLSAAPPTATTIRDGHAALAGRAVAGADRGVGGQLHVGVGQHDHVVLGAAQRLHALAVRVPVS